MCLLLSCKAKGCPRDVSEMISSCALDAEATKAAQVPGPLKDAGGRDCGRERGRRVELAGVGRLPEGGEVADDRMGKGAGGEVNQCRAFFVVI